MTAVTGSKDGLQCNNLEGQRVVPILTAKELKAEYLQGIKFEGNGAKLTEQTLEKMIDKAVSGLEHYLDISITPVMNYVENKDYQLTDYATWGYMQLNNIPVISINSIKMVYFRDQDGTPQTLQTLPSSWIRLNPHDGMLRLIPNSQFTSGFQVGNSGFFPEITRAATVPHLWVIDYNFGFADGKVPVAINDAAGLLAATQALSLAGNLILPPGLSGFSVSMDGLSESVTSVKSATSTAYAGLRTEYVNRLYGENGNPHNPGLLKNLRDFYRGSDFNII